MVSELARFFKPIASLKLTICCLVGGLVLITVGTLDQANIGIYEAQHRYFKSFLLYWQPPGTALKIPWFPGGYTVGGLLLANLIAAHTSRFKFSWKKLGIVVLHAGLILLLVGQLLTSLFQVESQMRLEQGEAKNYSESFYRDELAIIDTSAPDTDQVVSIPGSALRKNGRIRLPMDSLEVVLNEFYPNSAFVNPSELPSPSSPHLKLGPMAAAVPIANTYKQDERNMPAAAVSVFQKDQPVASGSLASEFPKPASFQCGGKTYKIVLRPKRYYKPFFVRLDEFRHDRYAGTDIPKNFSSRVRLIDPANHQDRESLIYMNHPLRYAGLTFYQAGFANQDRTTILQVVSNPSWVIPYLSCALMTFGMVIQFGMHLTSFVKRRVVR